MTHFVRTRHILLVVQ